MDKMKGMVTDADLEVLWEQVSSLKIRVSKLEQYSRLQNDINESLGDSLKKISNILKNLYIDKNYSDVAIKWINV